MSGFPRPTKCFEPGTGPTRPPNLRNRPHRQPRNPFDAYNLTRPSWDNSFSFKVLPFDQFDLSLWDGGTQVIFLTHFDQSPNGFPEVKLRSVPKSLPSDPPPNRRNRPHRQPCNPFDAYNLTCPPWVLFFDLSPCVWGSRELLASRNAKISCLRRSWASPSAGRNENRRSESRTNSRTTKKTTRRHPKQSGKVTVARKEIIIVVPHTTANARGEAI